MRLVAGRFLAPVVVETALYRLVEVAGHGGAATGIDVFVVFLGPALGHIALHAALAAHEGLHRDEGGFLAGGQLLLVGCELGHLRHGAQAAGAALLRVAHAHNEYRHAGVVAAKLGNGSLEIGHVVLAELFVPADVILAEPFAFVLADFSPTVWSLSAKST